MKDQIQKLKVQSSGFVILFAVVFSGILLAVGLGVANIALKEINFSTSARATNDAFLAADTGVECALYNDKEGSLSFVDSGSGEVSCLGIDLLLEVTVSGSVSTWEFVIPPDTIPGQDYCSIVTVAKDVNQYYTTTDIVSKGYNVGDDECSYNLNRVERELKVTYSTVPVPEPVAYWKFDETSGTTAVDSSFTGGNNGTLFGWNMVVNPWVAGQVNNALNFTGADETVSSGSSNLDDLSSFTFSLLIRPDTAGERVLISKSDNLGSSGGYRVALTATKAIFFSKNFSGGTNLVRRTADNFITVDGTTWTHLVVTWDGGSSTSGVHIYKSEDGGDLGEALYGTSSDGVGTKLIDAALNFVIGNTAQVNRDFDGLIDEVKVFDKVLSNYEMTTFLP